jgi:tetratricopeptide (TPR) repeat protein
MAVAAPRHAAPAAPRPAPCAAEPAPGPPDAFVALAAALSEYWIGRSLFREGQRWLGRALGRIDRVPVPEQARLLAGYAGALMGQGRFLPAAPFLARALPLSRAAGDPLDTAWTLILRGAQLNGGGDYRGAEAPLHEALAMAERIAAPALAAAVAGRALANLTVSARGQGASARATAYSERALRLYDGHGLDLAESISRMDLGGAVSAGGAAIGPRDRRGARLEPAHGRVARALRHGAARRDVPRRGGRPRPGLRSALTATATAARIVR